jgi:succinylarginine dihydrolase
MQVRVLDRCDECGELKEDVQERVNYWRTLPPSAVQSASPKWPVNAADLQPAIEQDSRRSMQVALLGQFFLVTVAEHS